MANENVSLVSVSSATGAAVALSPTQMSGQSITGNGTTLYRLGFRVTTAAGNTELNGVVSARVYAHSGTFGTSSVGTGSALATSTTMAVSALPASGSTTVTFFDFTGANQITLTQGTNYVVVVSFDSGTNTTGTNTLSLTASSSGTGTHPGNRTTFSGSTWSATSTSDMYHFVYGLTSNAMMMQLF